ncbi:hypothetical protein D046_0139A, partial [Vibrio parahaemolyticus V-223/04]
MLFLNLLIP